MTASAPRWARKAKPYTMPLDLTMMYSAVVICGDRPDDAGQSKRIRSGTGFIVTVPSTKIRGRSYGYVITPHHVICDLTNIEVEAANPYSQGELYPAASITDWRSPKVYPKADLAFAPYPIPSGQKVIALPLGALVQYGLDLSLGAQLHYVGLLAPLGIPMARSGTIGALDVSGIQHDGPYEYAAHLVDIRSYGGFSGSPCYVEYPMANLTPLDPGQFPFKLPHNFDEKPVGALAFLHLFCGMFTEHFSDKRMSGFASTLGTGVVLPADPIIEELMTDELRSERDEEDKRWIASQPESPIEAASDSGGQNDDFERFEDLTRRLVQTPKPKDED
jgi:hypothetical protein